MNDHERIRELEREVKEISDVNWKIIGMQVIAFILIFLGWLS